jgi:16S rRNA (cytosine1402-N4)-methyltransferase
MRHYSLFLSEVMVKESHHHNNSHVPVLLESVLQLLAPKPGESYLDLTAGDGGHATKVLSQLGDTTEMTLVDRDENAIAVLKSSNLGSATIIHQDFAGAAKKLYEEGRQFDMILIDLGVSSPHLDNAERGFSFQTEAPLDMRMDPRQDVTAEKIVNRASKDKLITILKSYGEEPKARAVADAIIKFRPIHTTLELAAIVEEVYGRRGKIHPATRTFQALRIAVNEELRQLEVVLGLLPDLLSLGGRAAIISFHSLEDRMVKQAFAEEANKGFEAKFKLLTKKPISGATEDVLNRRARSAKLRAVIKINT